MNSKINSFPPVHSRFLGVELRVRKACIFTHDIWWLEDLRWSCSNLSSIAVSEFRRIQIWFRDAKAAKYIGTSTGSTIFWMQQLLLLFHIHIFKKYRKSNHKLNANYCKRKVSTWKFLLLRKLIFSKNMLKRNYWSKSEVLISYATPICLCYPILHINLFMPPHFAYAKYYGSTTVIFLVIYFFSA